MGASTSASQPLASLFGKEQQGRRGPTLGSALLPTPEGRGWRLALMAPLCIQVFDAHTAQLVPMEESPAAAALQAHTPFTACCLSKDPVANPSNNISEQYMAVGSQDGTVLVFSLTRGTIHGPLHEFHVGTGDPQDDCRAGVGSLAMSITVVHFDSKSLVYAGSVGHCRCWNLETGALWREFPLPSTSSDSGSDRDVAPSSLVTTRRQLETGEVMLLWVGLDNGNIAVFDVESGMLVRSFLCAGPEAMLQFDSGIKVSGMFE